MIIPNSTGATSNLGMSLKRWHATNQKQLAWTVCRQGCSG